MRAEIIIIVSYFLIYSTVHAKIRRKQGPLAKDKDVKSCQEVAKTARFNPYSVLDDIWVVFYYWGPSMPIRTYKFAVPTKRNKEVLQKYLNDSRVAYPVNWTNPLFVMTEKYTSQSSLLVQMGDRGEFLSYEIVTAKLRKNQLIIPEDLNFKQIDNGKYLAYIRCLQNDTYMMSRPRDVPKKKYIQDVAAMLGFRGKDGKSYLYQGHQWMPTPEDDDYDTEMFYRYKCKQHMLENDKSPRFLDKPLDDIEDRGYDDPRLDGRRRVDDADGSRPDDRRLDDRRPDDRQRADHSLRPEDDSDPSIDELIEMLSF